MVHKHFGVVCVFHAVFTSWILNIKYACFFFIEGDKDTTSDDVTEQTFIPSLKNFKRDISDIYIITS